jgi:hypothetical protein
MAKGNVNGIQASGEDTARPAISAGKSMPISKGGTAIVGVSNTS